MIGRRTELAEIRQMVLDPEIHLVTLTGAGGIGKSLLGLHCVESLRADFEGRAYVVSLAWCQDIAQVISAIAHIVGVRQRDERPLRDRLIAELCAPKRLLVLDNAEHVLEPVSALVTQLLHACPELSMLVTSRIPLKIRGEHEYPVPPLELPDHYSPLTLSSVSASPAVQLFVKRAQAVLPRFALTESNAAMLDSICRLLDGVPLAIELAAARTKIHGLGEITRRLEAPLQFLERGQRDLPERQQGLRAAISWSHDLLSPVEQRVFRRLGVFAGGFTYDAAEWLMSDDAGDIEGLASNVDVGNALECLVDQSLISRRSSGEPNHRFDMLQTIRAFAAERLDESGERAQVANRHLAWCLALAESAEPNWFGPEQRTWLRRLELERGNLAAALAWSMQSGEVDAGARLAISLTDYWYLSGQLSEGRRWLERALDVMPWNPNNSASCHTRIRLQASVSQLAQPNGDLAVASHRADESLRLARELGELIGIARASALLGNIAIARGDVATAETYHQHALELFRRLDDRPWIVVGLNDLALVALMQGDFGGALTLATEAVHLARAIGDDWGEGIALRMLGDVALSRDGTKVAARCYYESLMLGQTNGSRWTIADGLAAFGSLAVKQGRPERGARFLGAANAIYDLVGVHMPPKLRPDWTVAKRAALESLGADRFNSAWTSGSNLSIEQCVAEALQYGRLVRGNAAA
jgi:non-specific serine/threonine protein kinase